jgi:capsular exopolysaccharide synthesis family protein
MYSEKPLPEPPEPGPSEQEIHLRDYWYVLLKRRWLITAVAVTGAVIVTVRTFMQTPIYMSTAVVQIHRGKINLVGDVMTRDTWAGYNEFYPTQQRVLTSRTLAYRVVDHLQLWNHPYFRGGRVIEGEPTPEARESLAGALGRMLQVSQLRNTQLMEVSFVSPEPELCALLANALVNQYIAFSGETESGVAKNTASFIREQIEKLQAEIQQKQKLLQEYSQRQDIVMVDQKENIVIQQLEDLNKQLTQAQGERAGAEARYRSLQEANPASLTEVANNGSIQSVKQQVAALQKQYAELSTKFQPDWPEMQRLASAIEEGQRRLERETQEVAGKVTASARMEYQAALKRESLLKEQMEKQKQEAQGLNLLAADYNRVKAELDSQTQMLQQLLRRHSETGLNAELGERQQVNVRVVEEALVPKAPFKPNRRRDILLGTLLALALAVGLAFFLDYWDTSIYTVEDLRRHVPLPYLGMIPRNTTSAGQLAGGINQALKLLPPGVSELGRRALGPGATSRTSYLPVPREPSDTSHDPLLAERFKFLRGSLLLSTPGAPPKVVLVTSPDKHAGKTFVTCNLAISLAELGKRVLLIDADLRNPHVHRAFQIRNKVGLTNVLTGQKDVAQGCVYSTHVSNVFVLLAGPHSPSSAELLASDTMAETLRRCAEHFDFVLLDSAPLLPVFDTHVLTQRAEAVLLVVRSGNTSRYAVKSSVELIERVGGKLTGVVLNDVNLGDYAQNYYYSYHSYEYGTYQREGSEHHLG